VGSKGSAIDPERSSTIIRFGVSAVGVTVTVAVVLPRLTGGTGSKS
jgi:hypothetical protein